MKRTIFASMIACLTVMCALTSASADGVVVDTDGKPVSGAEVYAMQYGDQGMDVRKVITDARGHFVHTPKPLPKRNWASYVVLADGYCFGRGFGDAGKKEATSITLYREQPLKGRVVDEQGKPLSGIKVTVDRIHAYGNGPSVEFNFDPGEVHISEAVTRRDGSFTLPHLPSVKDFPGGEVVVKAEMPGRAMVTSTVEQRDPPSDFTITLPRECALAGVLYLPGKSGTAPEGTSMVLHLVGGDWAAQREFSVGKDGRFLVTQLAPGKYRLVTGPDFMFYSGGKIPGVHVPEQPDWVLPAVEVSIEPDEAKVIDVVASPGAVIIGKVLSRDDGSPVPNAIVAAVHAGRPEGTTPTTAVTNDSGEYTVRVAAGEVSIEVSSVQSGNTSHTMQEGEKPAVKLSVTDGETKTVEPMKVSAVDPPVTEEDPSDSYQLAKELGKKPTLKDLILEPGSYRLTWDSDADTANTFGWTPQPDKDEDIRKLMAGVPKLKSDKPRYLAFSFGQLESGKPFFVVLDESHGTGTGYDTVYFDRNRNGDLSDVAPVKLPRQGMVHYTYSEWAKVPLSAPMPGDTEKRMASVRLQYYKSQSYEQITLQARGALRAKIASNKGALDCIVLRPLNGSYGKHTTRVDIYGAGMPDSIYIDTNGYGRAMALGSGPHKIDLHSPALVASRYYDIDVSKVGDSITVKPYEGALGRFTVTSSGISGFTAKPLEVDLYNDRGEYTFDLTKGPAVLPAGTYKIDHVKLDLTNKKGEQFTLSCMVHNRLTVSPDKETSIDVSGKVSFEIAPSTPRVTLESDAENSVNTRAKIGEGVTVLALDDRLIGTVGATSPGYGSFLSPHVDVLATSGKTLASVDAHYGWVMWIGDNVTAKLPALPFGPCELRITIDTKTPLGKLVAEKPATVYDGVEITNLETELNNAVKAGDTAKADKIRDKRISKLLPIRIKPGQPIEASHHVYGDYLTKDKLSAIVRYYPEKDYLRIHVDVTDAFFSTDAYEGLAHRESSIAFFVDPNGTQHKYCHVSLVPKGKNGIPEMDRDTTGVIAHYARTPKGYTVDIQLPWKEMKPWGYKPNWKYMPVAVEFNARTGKDRTQLNFAESLFDSRYPRGYVVLTRP